MPEAASSYPEARELLSFDDVLNKCGVSKSEYDAYLSMQSLSPESDEYKRLRFDPASEPQKVDTALRKAGYTFDRTTMRLILLAKKDELVVSQEQASNDPSVAVDTIQKKMVEKGKFTISRGTLSASVLGFSLVVAATRSSVVDEMMQDAKHAVLSIVSSSSEIERMQKELAAIPDVTVSFEGDLKKAKTVWMLVPMPRSIENFRSLHHRKMGLPPTDSSSSTESDSVFDASLPLHNRTDLLSRSLLIFDPEKVFCSDVLNAANMSEAARRLYGANNIDRMRESLPNLPKGKDKVEKERAIKYEEDIQESAFETLSFAFGRNREDVDRVLQRRGWMPFFEPRFNFSSFENLRPYREEHIPLSSREGIELALKLYTSTTEAKKVAVFYSQDHFEDITGVLRKHIHGPDGEHTGVIIIEAGDKSTVSPHESITGK